MMFAVLNSSKSILKVFIMEMKPNCLENNLFRVPLVHIFDLMDETIQFCIRNVVVFS